MPTATAASRPRGCDADAAALAISAGTTVTRNSGGRQSAGHRHRVTHAPPALACSHATDGGRSRHEPAGAAGIARRARGGGRRGRRAPLRRPVRDLALELSADADAVGPGRDPVRRRRVAAAADRPPSRAARCRRHRLGSCGRPRDPGRGALHAADVRGAHARTGLPRRADHHRRNTHRQHGGDVDLVPCAPVSGPPGRDRADRRGTGPRQRIGTGRCRRSAPSRAKTKARPRPARRRRK